jgi:hypothetical protein
MTTLLLALAVAMAPPQEPRAVFTYHCPTGEPVWDALECRRVYLELRLHNYALISLRWAEWDKDMRTFWTFKPEARSRTEARRLPVAVQAGQDLTALKEIEAAVDAPKPKAAVPDPRPVKPADQPKAPAEAPRAKVTVKASEFILRILEDVAARNPDMTTEELNRLADIMSGRVPEPGFEPKPAKPNLKQPTTIRDWSAVPEPEPGAPGA